MLSGICTAASADFFCFDGIPSTLDSQFTDNGNATISDAATGLMWKKCAEGLSGDRCASGSIASFTLQQALQHAANTDFSGHTDWRVPSKKELESLVEYWRLPNEQDSETLLQRHCLWDLSINSRYFPNTPRGAFWSSSRGGILPGGAWTVYFGLGESLLGAVRSVRNVRLVRTGK